MKINGTNGMNVPAGAVGMDAGIGGQTDPMVRDLQRQIKDLQNRMKELSANPELTLEMKSKKRQELQKQISDLEMQLRQRQMEVKREEAMKRSSKDYQADEMLGTKQQNSGKADKNSAGLSAGSMEAMISADASMKQADVHGSVARTMEGKAGVLEAEIKQDSAMGCKPAGKEEQLAEAEAKANEAMAAQMGTLAQASEDAQKANEADQSQDSTKSDKDRDGVQTDKEEEKEGSAAEKSDESKGLSDGNTFDTEQLGVPFSRGYQPVDVKL